MNRAEERGTAAHARTTTEENRYLVFTLHGEQYGLPLLQVKEVIADTETTPIPHAPAHFKGIMNLRGLVISVIDLRGKFRMPRDERGHERAIIILDLPDLSLGVVVDSVDYVHSVSKDEISAPPTAETHLHADYLLGVARQEKKLILLLDIERTLNVQDLNALKPSSKQAA